MMNNLWSRFAVRRLRSVLVGIVILIVGSFLMVRLIPGDPAIRIAGINATPEYLDALREQMGLNDPLPKQFADYALGALTLNLGASFRTGQPVSTILLDRFPLTLELAAAAIVIVLVVGVAVGIVAAILTKGDGPRRVERLFLFTTGAFAATPEFLLGMFLVFFFAVRAQWFPVAGAEGLQSLVLPALAVALPAAAMLSRIVRVQTAEVLRTDYIRTARSKRLPAWLLYARHAVPNVLTATLTIGSLMFISLLGGSVVVENIFAWPGLGTAIVEAIVARDYPVIQGAVLSLGVIVLVVNTGVDVILGLTDPRASIRQT
ncbi:ABC transporter permease [Rhodococcus wratislaviensis]|nr:ABC transporter permease [Rhodococcus wratislaviensis]